MKLNELISDFQIYISNEEAQLLERFDGVMTPAEFTERETGLIENLVKKSIISKVIHKGKTYLVKNDKLS